MSTENIKQLKEQLNTSLTDVQKQQAASVAEANKNVKSAKQNLKSAREAAKTAKENLKAAKTLVVEATENYKTVSANFENSFNKKQLSLKTALSTLQRELMVSRMGK